MQVSVKIEGIEKLGYLANQIPFAAAKSLTKTAQQGQAAVVDALESTFTLRTNWYKPANAVGIRITPAKKNNLVAEVKTDARFLKLHEEGGIKIPYGKYLAIPTANVRRTKKDLIPNSQKPGNLKNAFVVRTKKSGVKILYVRTGKGRKSNIKAMYVLQEKAKIKQVSVFYEPIKRAVTANLHKNFDEAFKQAVATAR